MTPDEQIWLCALRYAIGRRTYITGTVADYIISKIDVMSEKCRLLMVRDIKEAGDLGDNCDADEWHKLLGKLEGAK